MESRRCHHHRQRSSRQLRPLSDPDRRSRRRRPWDRGYFFSRCPAAGFFATDARPICRPVAASEHGVTAMVAAIRAGAKTQGELWFATFAAMFARTGEDPTRVSIGLDGPGNSTIGEPTSDTLKVGQILNEEIDATVQ